MKNRNAGRLGFTLIELLVVVLIIGILSAVALPQYQKAVEKSRVAEAVLMLNSIYKAYQVCRLSNEHSECLDFENLDIGFPSEILEDDCIDDQCFNTKDWQYGQNSDWFYANRVINGDTENYPYYLNLAPSVSSRIWCEGTCDNVCGNDGCTVQEAN